MAKCVTASYFGDGFSHITVRKGSFQQPYIVLAANFEDHSNSVPAFLENWCAGIGCSFEIKNAMKLPQTRLFVCCDADYIPESSENIARRNPPAARNMR
jgi:alpha-D-ribose 1-methylphosphonate 5-phosphate C-P lyase